MTEIDFIKPNETCQIHEEHKNNCQQNNQSGHLCLENQHRHHEKLLQKSMNRRTSNQRRFRDLNTIEKILDIIKYLIVLGVLGYIGFGNGLDLLSSDGLIFGKGVFNFGVIILFIIVLISGIVRIFKK